VNVTYNPPSRRCRCCSPHSRRYRIPPLVNSHANASAWPLIEIRSLARGIVAFPSRCGWRFPVPTRKTYAVVLPMPHDERNQMP